MRRTLALAATLLVVATAVPAAEVRAPAFAGTFYPADAAALRGAIEGFLADAAADPAPERPIALVVPHAGYVYSGPIAGEGYRQAAGFDHELVIVLGTNHAVPPFAGVALDDVSGYRTPLGVVVVDTALRDRLAALDRKVTLRPDAFAREHSVEVQLPFVQVLLPRAKVLTAVVGEPDLALARRFGAALASALSGRKALIVASSDLAHYPAIDAARAADREVLNGIAGLDPAAAAAAFARVERAGHPGLVTAACGQAPILTAMVAAEALGARRGRVVSAANSGDTVAGEPGRVVGYGAVVFDAGAGGPDLRALAAPVPPVAATALGADERTALLALARATLERYFATGTFPLPRPASARLARPQGVFVTLEERGELRGCIGDLEGKTPLALAVARMAFAAATQDPRFRPVRREELPAIALEISVLTPYAPIASASAIEVGRHGVLLEKGGRRAVFLPQVAPEQGWNRDELLTHLCEKGGLPGDCWRVGAHLSTFEAEVFSEKGAH